MFDPKPSLNKHDRNLARAGAYDDIRKARKIRARLGGIFVFVLVGGFFAIFPLHVLLFGGVPLETRLAIVSAFFSDLGHGAVAAFSRSSFREISAWFSGYWGWYVSALLAGGKTGGIALWKGAVLILPWFVATILPLSLIGPMTEHLESTPNIFGDTRWASERDIEAMSKRDLVGFDGTLFLVGKMKKKLIQMKETLSVLLLAPPGTGKTVAFIVPSTVMMDQTCQLLNDQKPELFHMTSGHRAGLGPVYQLMWSAQDMPSGGWMTEDQACLISPKLVEYDSSGNPIRDDMGNLKVKPIFYPSWNPIGPSSIPIAGPRRALYIERLAAVLCPDSQGGDKFWTSKARAALVGFVTYIVAKVEIGQDPAFPEFDETGIPTMWHGKEASLPMLVDWFTEAQNAIDDDGEDPMRQLFRNAIADARAMNEAHVAQTGIDVLNRAIAELTDLMNSPDKTRGSILTTLSEALNPFKNDAVRQRTSSSSFSFNELRGCPKPEAKAREETKRLEAKKNGQTYMPRYSRDEWNPITVYISINAEDAKAFATITGIFVDSANAYLVANGPNAIDDRGNQLGPHDFFFLLDETPTLPKLDTVINGPAVGRSKRVSYAIVGQDFAQIESRYSRSEVETMKSTTAIKVILSQNNETAAKSVATMAGSMTYKKASYARKEYGDPITKFLDLKKEIISSENWERRDFLDTSFIMSMPDGKHLVLVQNFMNRPILSDTPRFFEEPEIGKRVYNLRTGSGPRPALPMPENLIETAALRETHESRLRKKAIDLKAALNEPEVAILCTPNNISLLSFDFETKSASTPPGTDFAVARIHLTEKDRYFDPPADPDITVTHDPQTLRDIVADRKVYVFDDDDFDAANALLSSGGLPEIPSALMVQIKREALDIEDEDTGDFFTIGYFGTARNDRPDDLALITPRFALRWMCEIVNVVHGCAYEYRRISADP